MVKQFATLFALFLAGFHFSWISNAADHHALKHLKNKINRPVNKLPLSLFRGKHQTGF
jgi:hypothetical protein